MENSNHVITPKSSNCQMNSTECRQMFDLVKDMHTALCGDKEMRMPGLIKRVEVVENKVSMARYVGIALVSLSIGAAYGLKGGVEKLVEFMFK